MKEEYKAAAFKTTFSQLLYLETKKLEPFSLRMTKDLTTVHGILSHGFEKYFIKSPSLLFLFLLIVISILKINGQAENIHRLRLKSP